MDAAAAPELYLDLLKLCLTRIAFPDRSLLTDDPQGKLPLPFDLERRLEGRDWPTEAETMIGWHRLTNLQACATAVVEDDVPGDPARGRRLARRCRNPDACHARRLRRHEPHRVGRRFVPGAAAARRRPLPSRSRRRRLAGDAVAVPLDEVRRNFDRYGLLDRQVCFLPGWFRDTLPDAPIDELALIRLDGDLYESTIIALEALYPKLSHGGYVIVDDYGARLPGFADHNPAREAVDDYRAAHAIIEPLERVDWTGVCWRRD